MREAIRLSREKMQGGAGGPFGAIIVRGNEIIARGWNQVTSSNDPTAHAEVTAIREACVGLKRFHLSDCELYTSCEPCPMCLAAIYWSHIKHVYFANTRQDAAEIGFDDNFIYQQLPLPIEKRTLPMQQALREEAISVFAEWKTKPDKVEY